MTRDAGFTLLETIVMLVVVGLIVAGLAEGTRAGLATWSAETRWSHIGFDGESTERVLRELVTDMDPGDVFAGLLPVTAKAHSLSFATRLPVLPAGLRSREATVAIGMHGNDLVLRWTARAPAPTRSPMTHQDLLTTGVTALAFSYWLGGAWSDHWTGDGVPALVRIRITRQPSAGPEIPDIVVAPFRASPT